MLVLWVRGSVFPSIHTSPFTKTCYARCYLCAPNPLLAAGFAGKVLEWSEWQQREQITYLLQKFGQACKSSVRGWLQKEHSGNIVIHGWQIHIRSPCVLSARLAFKMSKTAVRNIDLLKLSVSWLRTSDAMANQTHYNQQAYPLIIRISYMYASSLSTTSSSGPMSSSKSMVTATSTGPDRPISSYKLRELIRKFRSYD